MSEMVSVDKINLLTRQIEHVTGENYNNLTAAVQDLKDGYGNSGGAGGAGGIIDVTELPTSNINTNAVYRVTENVQANITEVYFVGSREVVTVQQYLASQGIPTVPNIYVVDTLSNLKATDAQYFTEIHLYILRSDGICYANIPAYGGIITLGLFGYQAMGYDKGSTDDVYSETEAGVYTTIETYKDVIRYFVRKGGKWEEISALMNRTLPNGLNGIDVLSGSYSSNQITMTRNGAVLNVRNLIVNDKTIPSKIILDLPRMEYLVRNYTDFTHLSKDYFIDIDGGFGTHIGQYAFAGKYIVSADIPDEIGSISQRAFFHCYNLESIVLPAALYYLNTEAFAYCSSLSEVRFKSIPETIHSDVFNQCYNLTIIKVPWSEGDPADANAPWGARNATIIYNHTEE